MCGTATLTTYHSEEPFVVYCRECWLSDKWDPMNYGRTYDFSIPFFSQFRSLQVSVPRMNLYRTNFTRSDYCNYGLDFKDCYLLFGGKGNERVYFGNQVFESKDSFDVSFSSKIELSYEIFESTRLNKVFFSRYSQECIDSRYLLDCRNCMNCFGCVGLANKQYYIFNEPHSKESYEKFLDEKIGSYRKHLETLVEFKKLELKLPHRYARIYKSINSDGDDSKESKNIHMAFTSGQAEDSKYIFFCRRDVKNCYDNSFQGFGTELVYEIAHGFGGNNVAFGTRNINNQDARYNEECHECRNIFGCIGLRKKEYCILNKQYSKEEYEKFTSKIREHMDALPFTDSGGMTYKYGEFFPNMFSPFAYNETIAQEYFPLSKEQALKKNYRWRKVEDRNYKITLKNEDIPDDIRKAKDSITKQVIECVHKGNCLEQCTEAFKILPEELKFYRIANLPLPRLCPNCRNYQRLSQRNPLKLWKRKCMKEGCLNEFETSYAPDRPEIIYCEKCYQQEIY